MSDAPGSARIAKINVIIAVKFSTALLACEYSH
jgi:hypothetical protein